MTRASRQRWMGGVFFALGLFGAARPAQACGGCFSPPGSNAPVVGHRMAFALSAQRTVLWDQFEYAGAPEEFSWVLPVAPGAYLEASTDAFFEALEAYTQVNVAAPPLLCSSGGSGCDGCGVMAASDDGDVIFGAGEGIESGVYVLHRQTVGPYETVTLRSNSGDALTGWLLANGYVIPPDVGPVIQAYVTEGADFIALRLRPGAGVTQMTPVRVVTPGGTPLLPLRMVAAGTGEFVDIVLYLIGDQRFSMPDLLEVSPDLEALSFDYARADSNYLALRERALARNDGHVYVTAYAGREDLAGKSGIGWLTSSGRGPAGDLVTLYFQQALENAERTRVDSCNSVAALTRTNDLMVDDCDPSAATEGRACAAPGFGERGASGLECEQFDDIAAALIGQRPLSTWLTRLEMRLPRQALSVDCEIEPNFDQTPVTNSLQAERAENPPCEPPVFSSSLTESSRPVPGPYLLAAVLAAALARRGVKRRG